MLAFSNDYYGIIFRATQSVELFCVYRKKACEIPETADTSRQKQEVVQIPLWEEGSQVPDGISAPSPSICIQMQGIRVEIHEHAGADVIRSTLLALRQLC